MLYALGKSLILSPKFRTNDAKIESLLAGSAGKAKIKK